MKHLESYYLNSKDHIFTIVFQEFSEVVGQVIYKYLVTKLDKHGYYPVPATMGIFAHQTRKTKFCLCVDNFGVKYFNRT